MSMKVVFVLWIAGQFSSGATILDGTIQDTFHLKGENCCWI